MGQVPKSRRSSMKTIGPDAFTRAVSSYTALGLFCITEAQRIGRKHHGNFQARC